MELVLLAEKNHYLTTIVDEIGVKLKHRKVILETEKSQL